MCYNITSLCSDVFIICFRITAHVLWLYLSLAQSSFGTRDGFTHHTDRLPAERNDKNMKTWVILKYRSQQTVKTLCENSGTAAAFWKLSKTLQSGIHLISFCESGPKIVAYESRMFYCSWRYPTGLPKVDINRYKQ